MIDLYSDAGHAVVRSIFQSNPAVYELVKTANFEDERNEIPKSAFAWPERDLYPVHTKEHAVLSYAYAKTAGLKNAAVLATIEEALDAYGVELSTFTPPAEKTAAPEDCLFPEQRALPLTSPMEVKFAEECVLEQVDKLKPETIANTFSKLASKAEELGVELSSDSLKLAGQTVTDRAKLINELAIRQERVKQAEAKAAYGELITGVAYGRDALLDKVNQVKLAATIGTLDRKYGFERVFNPITTVFNTTIKSAEVTVDLGTCKTTPSALAALPLSFFSDALGPEFVSEISSGGKVDPQLLAQVVETLPANMKQSLASNLQAAGCPAF